MQIIDARNLACPQPVILAKKALEANGQVEILVDNQIAVENLRKLAQNTQVGFEAANQGDHFQVTLVADNVRSNEVSSPEVKTNNQRCLMITGTELGTGAQELGEILLKGLLYTLTETREKPAVIVLINSGVKLILDAEAKESLELLTKQGVKLLACGTCLNYYQLESDFNIGEVTNMYDIVSILNHYQVQSI